ncbi:hypothetical protein [Massilia sp. TS11]|uniref:hypothetical protein n=1 Tax=Massilia sp. TS11 TaxID=2908003 RepID=UPI001EDBB635|nr:hypothetical protein [Massilia sp. TS11]MCG2585556.1 hypothetical protein [Massilia sp. TS11]
MKSLLVSLLPVAAAVLLVACGGGAATSGSSPTQLSSGTVSVDPAPVAVTFTAMAKGASCAGTSNRLYIIDNKQVFWARSGNCADNSYGYTLFGATPEQTLCSAMDTIAGPRTLCSDERYRELFVTMTKNLDKPDLGLGKDHKVEELNFLPPADAKAVPMTVIESAAMSGVVKRQQLVIKDADTLTRIWNEHASTVSPMLPVPEVNFREQMVIAVFTGQSNDGCKATAIKAVTQNGAALSVAYTESVLQTFAICPAVMTSAMQMVTVPRSDLPVSFTDVTANLVKANVLAESSLTGVAEARTAVVKDEKEFFVLMKQFYGDQAQLPLPVSDVDFSRQMVVAVFLGTKPNGCAGIAAGEVFTQDGKLHVTYHERSQIRGAMCSLNLTAPGLVMAVPKSDAPVIFSADGLPF